MRHILTTGGSNQESDKKELTLIVESAEQVGLSACLASLRIETSLRLDVFTRTDCCHRLLTPVASLYLQNLTTAIKIMKEPSSLDNGLQLRERAM